MCQIYKGLIIAFATIVLSHASTAQQSIYIELETNMPNALVQIDSLQIGTASTGRFVIPSTAKFIRLVPPEIGSWSIEPIETPIAAQPGDTVALTIHFPYHYRIESIPYDAEVYLEEEGGRTSLGKTPLIHTRQTPLEQSLVIERDGYLPARIDPGKQIWNRHSIILERAARTEEESAEITWIPPSRHREWIDYAALGFAAAAGVLTVHYKTKADNLYEQYRETGNESLRGRINSFDTRAGVSLAAMQVGVGVFAIRLALR